MAMTDIGFEGRWSQPMIVISSTKLAKSLDGRSGASLPPAAPDGEGLLACLARYARVAVYRELQPHADQIDGATRHDSGAASHLHSGGRKAACYEGRKPAEFDAISNQRRDRGAGGAVQDQVVC